MAKEASFFKILTTVTLPMWGLMVPLSLVVWLVTLPLSIAKKIISLIKGVEKAKMKVEVSGKAEKDAVDTVLFVHGWPDSAKLWDQQVVAFTEAGYRCIAVTAPGYDGEEVGWGYTHEQISEMLAEVVEKHTESKKVTVFCHDWGCFWGYLLQANHPAMVKRMIALDVGGVNKPSAAGILFILSYQFYNMLAFLLGGPAGAFMNKMFLSTGKYKARPMSQCVAGVNYPYLYMVIKMFTGKAGAPLRPYKSIPMLYGYAKKKLVGFHTQKWIDDLNTASDCGTKEFDCDHWIPVHKSEELNKWVLTWLEAKNSKL
eukprot:TRINITY_DN175_c25_g1_i1.p1 TRINITY_DN175_c25_g1~~TRINITY_DN175_c25_g1_i1.p1  ORF type:complete len:331 (+),score=115.47 TRINITY_DN175_c25_g1_i1:54-995(+)